MKYTTTSTGVGYGSGFELTKDTPYLALTGELWDVFCEYFDEKRSCYKGVLLYLHLYNHYGMNHVESHHRMFTIPNLRQINPDMTWIYMISSGMWWSLKPRVLYQHEITLIPIWVCNDVPISVKCGMKLLIHSPASTVQPLKFGNRWVVPSHTLWEM